MHLDINEEDLQTVIKAAEEEYKMVMLNDLLNMIEDNILRMDLIGVTSQLFSSVKVDFEAGTVTVNAPHGIYVEFGTVGQVKVPIDPYSGSELAGPHRGPGRKGPPPREAISAWARKKLAEPPTKSLTVKQGDIIGEKVRWKIYWYGSKPKPFVRDAIVSLQQKYDNLVLTLEVAA